MKTLLNTIGLMAFFSLLSCTKEISVDVTHEPEYVVFGSMSNIEKPISISITQSVPVNSKEKSLPVNDARVSLFAREGDEKQVILTDDFTVDKGIYTSVQSIAGTTGTSYWIEVTLSDGNKFVSAEEQMKKAVPIATVDYESFYQVKVSFADPGTEHNYYLLESEFINKGKLFSKTFAVSDDVIFDGNASATVDLDIFYKPNGDEETLKVSLSNINYSSYQFHLNRWKQKEDNDNNSSNQDNGGGPGPMFSTPPVNLYGNIKNSTDGTRVLGNFTVGSIYVEEL
jgi:hypothetical protein